MPAIRVMKSSPWQLLQTFSTVALPGPSGKFSAGEAAANIAIPRRSLLKSVLPGRRRRGTCHQQVYSWLAPLTNAGWRSSARSDRWREPCPAALSCSLWKAPTTGSRASSFSPHLASSACSPSSPPRINSGPCRANANECLFANAPASFISPEGLGIHIRRLDGHRALLSGGLRPRAPHRSRACGAHLGALFFLRQREPDLLRLRLGIDSVGSRILAMFLGGDSVIPPMPDESGSTGSSRSRAQNAEHRRRHAGTAPCRSPGCPLPLLQNEDRKCRPGPFAQADTWKGVYPKGLIGPAYAGG